MRLRVAGWFLLLAVMVSSVPLSLTGIVGIDCPCAGARRHAASAASAPDDVGPGRRVPSMSRGGKVKLRLVVWSWVAAVLVPALVNDLGRGAPPHLVNVADDGTPPPPRPGPRAA